MYKSRHCPINLNSLLSKKVLPILFPKSALISKWPYTIICALFFFSISAYRYQDCLRFQDRSVPERELFLDWLNVTRREEKESKGKQRKEKKRKEQKRREEKRNEMKRKKKKRKETSVTIFRNVHWYHIKSHKTLIFRFTDIGTVPPARQEFQKTRHFSARLTCTCPNVRTAPHRLLIRYIISGKYK